MKSYSNFLVGVGLVLITLFSSSCFDIYEKIHFNRDGSGHVDFTMDLSKMIGMLDMLGGMGNTDGEEEGESEDDPAADFSEEMSASMREQMEELKKVPGISNVTLNNSDEKGVISWSYDFSSIESLNRAIGTGSGADMTSMASAIGGNESEGSTDSQEDAEIDLFFLKGKKLTRKFKPMSDEDLANLKGDDFDSMKFMFEDASYTMEYSFEGDVKKLKAKPEHEFDQSLSGKTIKLSVGFLEMLETKGLNEYQIKFK